MKKWMTLGLFMFTFFGFLASQIVWDMFHLNAEQVEQSKEKYGLYQDLFTKFSATTSKGTKIVLKERKEPIVLLNFWASWCLPCLKEFPSLVKFKDKFKDQVFVVGINGDEDKPEQAVEKIERKYTLNFESVLDPNSQISDQFLVSTYPISIVFVKGKVIFVTDRNHDFMDEEFIKLVRNHLK